MARKSKVKNANWRSARTQHQRKKARSGVIHRQRIRQKRKAIRWIVRVSIQSMNKRSQIRMAAKLIKSHNSAA